MQQLIDASVFCGCWPFRPLRFRTPTLLKERLRKGGVSQVWVSAVEAILYPDPLEANEPLFEAIRSDDFFVPVAITDPTLASWREDAGFYLEKFGCKALKLVPNYHGYEVEDYCVDDAAAFAREADMPLCVQIRVMDERAHHPLMKVPPVPAGQIATLARRHPDVRFLACGAYRGDLSELSKAPNLWVEISLVEGAQTIVEAVQSMGPRRVVFGSHSPFLYLRATLAKLEAGTGEVAPEVVEAVRAANARELMDG